jgi:hypothetical protein
VSDDAALLKLFSALDKDNSGSIDVGDLRTALWGAGHRATVTRALSDSGCPTLLILTQASQTNDAYTLHLISFSVILIGGGDGSGHQAGGQR